MSSTDITTVGLTPSKSKVLSSLESDDDLALSDLKAGTHLPSSKGPVSKIGDLRMQDTNTVSKYLFKNWKQCHGELNAERLAVFKSATSKEKVKIELPLAQSYATYPFKIQGESEDDRMSAFYLRTAKGEEQIFKVPSKDEAKNWIACCKINSKILDQALLKTFPNPRANFDDRALKMGWVREKTPSYAWKWRFMIMTDCAVYLFEKAPEKASQLSGYQVMYPLAGSKQRDVSPSDFPEAENEGIKFAFALLSQHSSSFIATETKNENRNWLNAMKSMTLDAVKKIAEFSFPVNLPGEDKNALSSTLVVSRAGGITLKKSDGDVSWSRPLNQFKQYRVDKKSVILDFGKFSEVPVEFLSPDGTTISIIIPQVLETFMDPAKLMI